MSPEREPDDYDELDADDDEGRASETVVSVEITGLSLYTHHGVTEAEREIGQRLLLDLRFEVGECDATVTDRVEDTVDYAEVCQTVALVAQQRSYRTLERLCAAIADRLLDDFDHRLGLREGLQARAAAAPAGRGRLGRALARAPRGLSPARVGYLGLGSNVGDRRGHLEAAVAALPRHGVTVLGSSSVYETEPVGEVLDQREFLNACLRVETVLEPDELLDACKAVERELGREPGPRHGPRPIDVDLLLLSDVVYSSDRLALPHAEVTSRRFVLVPLLELDPELTTPVGVRLADALAGLGTGQDVRAAGPPLV